MRPVRARARSPRSRIALHLAALLLALLGAPAAARADEPSVTPSVAPPLRWDPAWAHANAWDVSLSSFGATTLVLETIFLQSRQAPVRFHGPLLFDASARSFFRANDPSTRLAVADTSWIFWGLDVLYPLVDVSYAWARYGPDVARDLFWQDATALAVASAMDMTLRDVVGRARPNDSDCLAAGGGSKCLVPESVRSFPSGHFVEATTGASLICTQHLYLKLYGGPWDAVTCGAAMMAAATVGVMRMVADDHWATDVIGSGAMGALFGWGIPYLMHLRWHTPRSRGGAEPRMLVMPTPMALSHGAGIGVTGIVF